MRVVIEVSDQVYAAASRYAGALGDGMTAETLFAGYLESAGEMFERYATLVERLAGASPETVAAVLAAHEQQSQAVEVKTDESIGAISAALDALMSAAQGDADETPVL